LSQKLRRTEIDFFNNLKVIYFIFQFFSSFSWMDDATFNEKLKDIFYQGRPCSYHYTKSLAEHLIAQEVERGFVPSYSSSMPTSGPQQVDSEEDEQENSEVLPPPPLPPLEAQVESSWRPFPAVIIRPSIITSAWREPFPGWIDNYNGTTGFMVVSGKGVLRTIHVNPDFVTDMVPVDVVINACIAAGWYVAVCQPKVHSFPRAARRLSTVSASSGLSSAGTSVRGGLDLPEPLVINCVSGLSLQLNPLFKI